MAPEIWAVFAAALLLIAAVTSALAWFSRRRFWDAVAVGARVAALAVLIVALVMVAVRQGHWMAADPRQAVLSLVAAMLTIHTLLAWGLGATSAGPLVDIIALGLGLVGAFVTRASDPMLLCAQGATLVQAHWVLFSLGGGSVLVAACAGLMLGLRAVLAWRGKALQLPGRLFLYGLLTQAANLALVALGGGLVIGVWWAWRTSGILLSANAREVWIAVAWLTMAMSVLAWRLDRHRHRWGAVLALVAAMAVLVGLLFPVDVIVVGI